jgi:hypothetical protein
MGKEELYLWLNEHSHYTLFTNGATKGNLGAIGTGGVIIGPDGQYVASFAWEPGISSNNDAEKLAIWQGLIFLNSYTQGAMIIIEAFKGTNAIFSPTLSHIIQRARLLIKKFRNVSLFHILHENNCDK